MNQENLFEQDWRDCLRAHYVHVIRERDVVNEESLITVLRQTGFSDDDINAIRAETASALGWETPVESKADSESEIVADAPPDAAPKTPAEVLPEPSQQAEQSTPLATIPPAKPIEPAEEDNPPKPESFKQMSLF